MTEHDSEIVKPELMKSYVWLQTSDGSIQQVEQEVAIFCPFICHEIHLGLGSSKNHPISLPPTVNLAMLSMILDYCHFHQVPGRSNKERKSFDEKFIRMDIKRLCELTSAADSLELKPLVDLTSRALARMIEGKTPEEIRDIFHLPDDLTEEEKLEPLKNTMDDPRIRLLNRLYARKRKELKEREKLKNVEVEEEQVDQRSVDDLLSFINGANVDSKGVRTSKSRRKNRRRKDQQKNAPLNGSSTSDVTSSLINATDPNVELNRTSLDHDATVNGHFEPKPDKTLNLTQFEGSSFVPEEDFDDATVNGHFVPKPDKTLNLTQFEGSSFVPEEEFGDGDLDDEIDPAIKEEIDREVADFARRLNSDWPERMQEILSLGQGRRQVPITISGSSLRRHR